jgi:hypothetical protein
MKSAAAFKWQHLQAKALAGSDFRMTNLLSAIKPTSLRILAAFFTCHLCYISLRLALSENRPLSINAYYGFNTSSSPFYEVINVSQVFYRILASRCIRLTLNICSFWPSM